MQQAVLGGLMQQVPLRLLSCSIRLRAWLHPEVAHRFAYWICIAFPLQIQLRLDIHAQSSHLTGVMPALVPWSCRKLYKPACSADHADTSGQVLLQAL